LHIIAARTQEENTSRVPAVPVILETLLLLPVIPGLFDLKIT